MSESNSPSDKKSLTERLDDSLKIADNEPVVINRNGKKYVLMSSEEYVKMKEQMENLQKSLTSTLDHISGTTK